MKNNAPETNNFLNWVEIKNFKSIKALRLDCKRVNVFIGKPNVGKSNILEGLGLLGAGYDEGKFLRGAVRYNDIKNLFWDSDTSSHIQIVTDNLDVKVSRLPSLKVDMGNGQISEAPTNYSVTTGIERSKAINSTGFSVKINYADGEKNEPVNLQRRLNEFNSDLKLAKKYDYFDLTTFNNSLQDFLLPPNGSNLYSIIRQDRVLWAEFAKLFVEQKLEFVLYDEKQEFILQKKDGPFVVQYPFFSIADTFRRYMFYITAIESNKNSVIIFEEPEVHSFPPYVKAMAHRMVSSETNQFFVSTHSPYLLQTLISELDESELAVYITYYRDYQTHVHQLTAEELQEAQDLGIDLFYNLSRYEPNA